MCVEFVGSLSGINKCHGDMQGNWIQSMVVFVVKHLDAP